MLPALLASIPSPPDNSIGIGPLQFRAYGLAIAVGVLVAIEIARRRWAARGGDPEAIIDVAKWAVPAGVIGARLYHVATDWYRFDDRPWAALFIWEGGLGIPGGLLGGVAVGVWAVRRKGLPTGVLLDVAAPAIPVAQAIGRLGNWFNQELYGRPTDLPWGLEIDPEHRPAEHLDVETFHPTFLYEALWNLALAGLLVLVDRRWRLRPGQLFTLYVAGYFTGRIWVEAIRIDDATRILGVRVNIWVSAIVIVAAVTVMVLRGRRRREPDEATSTGDDVGEDRMAADDA